MGRYVKKPVTVDAFRLGYDETPDWALNAIANMTLILHGTMMGLRKHTDIYADVETLEGWVCARYGDYIIRGVKGEIYPCKPDIFEKTYESDCGSDLHLKAGEKPRFKPGDAVWIISRDGDGQPDNGVECHSFLCEVGGVVIVSGDIFKRGALTRLLNKMVRQTRGYICATVMAIPSADCYATRNEAWAAYSKEVDGE